jgi:hypothetical protein
MTKGVKMPDDVKQKMIEKQIKVFSYRRKPFCQINRDGQIVAFWNSLGELNRLTGIRPYYVQRVLHGQFKKFKNCYWKYLTVNKGGQHKCRQLDNLKY